MMIRVIDGLSAFLVDLRPAPPKGGNLNLPWLPSRVVRHKRGRTCPAHPHASCVEPAPAVLQARSAGHRLEGLLPAKVVSERLGHATIAITMDTYSHVLLGLDAEAAGTVARLILGDRDQEPRCPVSADG